MRLFLQEAVCPANGLFLNYEFRVVWEKEWTFREMWVPPGHLVGLLLISPSFKGNLRKVGHVSSFLIFSIVGDLQSFFPPLCPIVEAESNLRETKEWPWASWQWTLGYKILTSLSFLMACSFKSWIMKRVKGVLVYKTRHFLLYCSQSLVIQGWQGQLFLSL